MTSASKPSHYFWEDRGFVRRFSTAISLHSHTQFSRELLDFIPRYSRQIPILSNLVQRQEQRFRDLHGHAMDYRRAWWTPPLAPREAYNLERQQIEKDLGLHALVSLSDHDDIQAPTLLSILPEYAHVPISLEWTLPFENSFLHIGVHNLPRQWAPQVMERLGAYTDNPQPQDLSELLCILNGFPSTLVVLNHPMWDELGIGAADHRALVQRFLDDYREWIHALELNGLRGWNENAEVEKLSRAYCLPLISGGDRHGCEPNALVNLTNAGCFSGFVDEVRRDRHSIVLYMNHYKEPLQYRLLQGVLDVIRDYTDWPADRRRWTDRVFYQGWDGTVKRLSSLWKGDGPAIVRAFICSVRLLESRQVRTALRMALAEERQEVST
ncbi:MAG TPA: hypothetical protein VEQ63_12215 [Bryobacteraceae bacterium]|nr:hypothetical protein [Bryobacteraceae bacterium]